MTGLCGEQTAETVIPMECFRGVDSWRSSSTISPIGTVFDCFYAAYGLGEPCGTTDSIWTLAPLLCPHDLVNNSGWLAFMGSIMYS